MRVAAHAHCEHGHGTPQPGPAAEPPALPWSASPNVTTGRRPQHRSSSSSYANSNSQQRQHNDGQFERLLHEHQLETVDFFANGRMFALGAFLDALGDRIKNTFEKALVGVGRQLNDNARRIDVSIAGLQVQHADVKAQLYSHGAVVDHALSNIGQGITSLHAGLNVNKETA